MKYLSDYQVQVIKFGFTILHYTFTGGGVLSELTDLMFSSKKKKKEKKEKYMTQKCASVTKQNNLVSAKGGDLFGRESSREPGGK